MGAVCLHATVRVKSQDLQSQHAVHPWPVHSIHSLAATAAHKQYQERGKGRRACCMHCQPYTLTATGLGGSACEQPFTGALSSPRARGLSLHGRGLRGHAWRDDVQGPAEGAADPISHGGISLPAARRIRVVRVVDDNLCQMGPPLSICHRQVALCLAPGVAWMVVAGVLQRHDHCGLDQVV